MEKLAYAIWKPGHLDATAFRDLLIGDVATELQGRGALGLRVSCIDDDVAAGTELHLSILSPAKSGFVSFWLDASQDRNGCEQTLARAALRIAGYLVVESRPLAFDLPERERVQRMPGFVLTTCIEPKDGMAYADFIDHWYGVHREVAEETQSTFAYVRNEIVRPLTDGAPAWAAVVEEGFPIEALDDPRVFYDWRGSEDRHARNLARMMDSCRVFLALDRVDSHPMSQYGFRDA